jgi:polyisoprenoid-binding protein YceI
MSTTSAVTTAPTQATRLPVGTWQIDPVHSSLEFQVRNMGLVTVKGFFADFEGTLEVDENGRTQAEGTFARRTSSTSSSTPRSPSASRASSRTART